MDHGGTGKGSVQIDESACRHVQEAFAVATKLVVFPRSKIAVGGFRKDGLIVVLYLKHILPVLLAPAYSAVLGSPTHGLYLDGHVGSLLFAIDFAYAIICNLFGYCSRSYMSICEVAMYSRDPSKQPDSGAIDNRVPCRVATVLGLGAELALFTSTRICMRNERVRIL